MSHRASRCPNHRLRSDFHWYRPENPNPSSFSGSGGGDTTSSSNPATVFVQQDPRPAVNIEPRQPTISPDVLIYEANVQPNASVETSDVQDTTQATDGVSFNPPNNSAMNSHVSRHQSAQRCPYYRRLSMSGYHNAPSSIINYHSSLQNGSGYLRPAYAPHESLW